MANYRFPGKSTGLLCLAAITLLGTGSAHAYTYGPESRAEWDGWPEYCKARYTVSLIGGSSEYAREVDRGVVERWQGQMGDCWRYLHHHCAGILQLNRAKTVSTPQDRKFALESVIKEDQLAADFCPASHPFSANIATHMALAYAAAGNYGKADQSLGWAIKTHPTFTPSYLEKAALLKRTGKLSAARDVLLAGNVATQGSSAELQNALGFSYLNTMEYEKAREHARKAYELGFPLPGLRDKLAKAGYPL